MKKITMYKADDGAMYETEEEADQADRRVSLKAWLDDVDTDWRNVQIRKLLDDVLDWVDAQSSAYEELE
jgi:hypothetical protein